MYCCILLTALLCHGEFLVAEKWEGSVVTASRGKLTMVDQQGKNERTYTVADNADIRYDGKTCKLDDLQAGSWAAITLQKRGDQTFVTRIEARKAKPNKSPGGSA